MSGDRLAQPVGHPFDGRARHLLLDSVSEVFQRVLFDEADLVVGQHLRYVSAVLTAAVRRMRSRPHPKTFLSRDALLHF